MLKYLYSILLGNLFFNSLMAQDRDSINSIIIPLSNSQLFANNYFQDQLLPKIVKTSGLLNGKEYSPNPNVLKEGTLFYKEDNWIKGAITYRGILYKNQYLKYDLLKDVVLTPSENFYIPLQLISEFVDSFTLENHRFIHFKPDKINRSNNENPTEGFYELIYDGISKILVKRSITIQMNTTDRSLEYIPRTIIRYFIYVNGIFQEFNNQNSLLKICKNQKKELIQFINKNKIKFKYDPELTMKALARQYDYLQNR